MSIPPLPEGAEDSVEMRAANAVHSLAIHLLRRARAADRATGLSPERLSLLSVVAYAGPVRVGALAEAEGVTPPAISRIVKSLESDGFVTRIRAPEDAREVLVAATAKGRKLMENGRRRRIELIAAEFRELSPRELSTVTQAATILMHAGHEARKPEPASLAGARTGKAQNGKRIS